MNNSTKTQLVKSLIDRLFSSVIARAFALIGLVGLILAPQHSSARTAIAGPLLDLQTTLPTDYLNGGSVITNHIDHLLVNCITGHTIIPLH
jgi:hypothetical protein